jgi:hypothetical protein
MLTSLSVTTKLVILHKSRPKHFWVSKVYIRGVKKAEVEAERREHQG